MKTNSFAIDPDLEAQLGDCQVGETKKITIEVQVTGKDETGLSGEIIGVEPYESENGEGEGEGDPSAQDAATDYAPAAAPVKGKAPGSGAKAMRKMLDY